MLIELISYKPSTIIIYNRSHFKIQILRFPAFLTFKVRLRLGMYSVYIKDWLRVFPKSQLLILSLEDYAKHTRKILNEVYKFLDISKFCQTFT